MIFPKVFALSALLLSSAPAFSNQITPYQTCILNAVESNDGTVTLAEIKAGCRNEAAVVAESDILASRRLEEQQAEISRRALVPHRRNYLLPAAYAPDPNEKPVPPAFTQFFPDEDLDNVEMKFQLSLKYQFAKSVFMRDDQFHFGLTTLSFWQAYNSDVSAPFRETNYEPEVFWTAPVDWRPLGIDASEIRVGFSHQSNGQSGTLSRSWNRVYAKFTWEAGNFVFNFKPWYRIREDEKDSLLDPKGDDNPDIEQFLGHFEFETTYRTDNHEFTMLLRNNLRSENRGAVQLDWTFPIWRGLKGHAQYFNGYGESLIDYNRQVERIGFGLLLSDLY
jgi:phospholipase A1